MWRHTNISIHNLYLFQKLLEDRGCTRDLIGWFKQVVHRKLKWISCLLPKLDIYWTLGLGCCFSKGMIYGLWGWWNKYYLQGVLKNLGGYCAQKLLVLADSFHPWHLIGQQNVVHSNLPSFSGRIVNSSSRTDNTLIRSKIYSEHNVKCFRIA